jgi:hypothetical protein
MQHDQYRDMTRFTHVININYADFTSMIPASYSSEREALSAIRNGVIAYMNSNHWINPENQRTVEIISIIDNEYEFFVQGEGRLPKLHSDLNHILRDVVGISSININTTIRETTWNEAE